MAYIDPTDILLAAAGPTNYVEGTLHASDASYLTSPRVVDMLSAATAEQEGDRALVRTPRGLFVADVVNGTLTLQDP